MTQLSTPPEFVTQLQAAFAAISQAAHGLVLECGCIPGHRILVTTGACADCDMTEREFADHGNRPCARGLWPRDVAVPLRPVLGLRNAPLGEAEGDLCMRSQDGRPPCLGVLDIRTHSSHGGRACCCGPEHPPCSWCLA